MNLLTELRETSAHDIFHWKKPKVSGVALVICLGVWWTLFCGASNLLSTTCRIINILFLLGAIQRFGYLHVTEEKLLRLNDHFNNGFRKAIHVFFPLFTWETPAHSATVVIFTFVTAFMAWWFSYSNAVLILIIYLFAAPTVYKQNKTVIDQQLNKINQSVKKVFPAKSDAGSYAKEKKNTTLEEVSNLVEKAKKEANSFQDAANDIRRRRE